jgi:hypothetical protein
MAIRVTIMPPFSEQREATAKYLACSSNKKLKSHKIQSIHAEHDCIRKLEKLEKYRRHIKKKEKIDMIVIRYSVKGYIGLSKPCKGCLMRLEKCDFNIRYIYYSDSYGDIVREKFKDLLNSDTTSYSSATRFKKGVDGKEHKKRILRMINAKKKHDSKESYDTIDSISKGVSKNMLGTKTGSKTKKKTSNYRSYENRKKITTRKKKKR